MSKFWRMNLGTFGSNILSFVYFRPDGMDSTTSVVFSIVTFFLWTIVWTAAIYKEDK